MSLLLKNADYIDWKTFEIKTGCNILVESGESGKISFIDPVENFHGYKVLDCTGQLVTKSLGNGHHHIYSALARGMDAPPVNPSNFLETLKFIWWRLDKSLDAEMIRASALYSALDSAKNGVTFVIDHHASPFSIPGSLEIIKEAFESVGISHLLCYEISDRDGNDSAIQGLDETEEYLANNQGLIGLHASFTVSDDTLAMASHLASKTGKGIHIHVAEDNIDQTECLAKYGERVIHRLDRWGLCDYPSSILAHCIHLNMDERRKLASKPAWIVQNAESNLNNQVGFFTGNHLGRNIMLGTDGMHSDMFLSARVAYFSGKNYERITPSDIYGRLRNIHKYISDNNFSGDDENNLIILDYNPPTKLTSENFPGHFFYGLNSKHVNHVISKGRIIVKDRQVQTIDESDVIRFCKEQSERLWEKMKSI